MSLEQRIISESQFENMKKTFDKNIKEKIGDAYSNYVLVPIEDLKDYITKLEKDANNNNTELKAMRVHFASTNDEKGQLTVVLEGIFADDKLKADLVDNFEPCPTYCEMGGL
jgi:hypothetical protein